MAHLRADIDTSQIQAVLFHSRERRRSLAGIPELFRTHRFVGATDMPVANIAAASFPSAARTAEITFKTAIRVDDNTTTRTGLIFEFGDDTTGLAIWIEDQKISIRAGGLTTNGVLGSFNNGVQWPATLELDIVAAVRPGLGAVALWLNGKEVIKAQNAAKLLTNLEWAATSAGSFAAAVQGTTPSDVAQTGAPANFEVIEPMSVFVGQRPRQFTTPV